MRKAKWFYVAQYSGNGLYATTISNGEVYAVRIEKLSTKRTKRHNFTSKESALEFAAMKTN